MGNLLKWLFCALIACPVVGLFFAVALPAGPPAPGIIITEPNFDFGELSETAPLSHVFIVRNNGKATLNIRDVQPS